MVLSLSQRHEALGIFWMKQAPVSRYVVNYRPLLFVNIARHLLIGHHELRVDVIESLLDIPNIKNTSFQDVQQMSKRS